MVQLNATIKAGTLTDDNPHRSHHRRRDHSVGCVPQHRELEFVLVLFIGVRVTGDARHLTQFFPRFRGGAASFRDWVSMPEQPNSMI